MIDYSPNTTHDYSPWHNSWLYTFTQHMTKPLKYHTTTQIT